MYAQAATRLLPSALAALIAAPQLAMASSDAGTLLVGHTSFFCGPGEVQSITGYDSLVPIGSYSPTGLTSGGTVAAVIDFSLFCLIVRQGSEILVSFPSNPGSSWLSSVTCNGITNNVDDATFTYNKGTATWSWNQQFGLNSRIGSNVSCTIAHR